MRATRPLGRAQPVDVRRAQHERQDAVLRRAWVCADGHGAHLHRAMLSHADRWIGRHVLRVLGMLGLLGVLDGSTATHRMHAQAPKLRPVLALAVGDDRGRSGLALVSCWSAVRL